MPNQQLQLCAYGQNLSLNFESSTLIAMHKYRKAIECRISESSHTHTHTQMAFGRLFLVFLSFSLLSLWEGREDCRLQRVEQLAKQIYAFLGVFRYVCACVCVSCALLRTSYYHTTRPNLRGETERKFSLALSSHRRFFSSLLSIFPIVVTHTEIYFFSGQSTSLLVHQTVSSEGLVSLLSGRGIKSQVPTNLRARPPYIFTHTRSCIYVVCLFKSTVRHQPEILFIL